MELNPSVLSETLDLELMTTNPFITSDMSPKEVAIMRQRESFIAKLTPRDTSLCDDAAISAFFAANDHCGRWEPPDGSQYVDDILYLARDLIWRDLDTPDGSPINLSMAVQHGRPGPGSSVETDGEDFLTKVFAGRLSMTSEGLYRHYCASISPEWLTGEVYRKAVYGNVVVEGSKLSTVPKNERTSRTICIEPSLNMFYQLGVGRLLETQLKKFNIDLSRQPLVNRWLARKGSIDGSLATIDLKSASDTIAYNLVRWLLPPVAFGCLDVLRSPYVSYKGERVQLQMFSSMGNGFTFPLQTYIFATLVRATYLAVGLKPIVYGENRNLSVFGDDIICASEIYHPLSRVLERAGFMVNSEKSYHNGLFRESCGADYFKGVDVRPIYLKELRSTPHVYSIFNRLYVWSARHKVCLANTLSLLRKSAPFRPIPFDESDISGFKTPSCSLTNRKHDANGAVFYRALAPVAREVCVDRFDVHPAGVLVALVGGYIRNGKISLRQQEVKLQVVRKRTPSWDFIPYPGLTIREFTHVSAQLDLTVTTDKGT